MNDFLTILDATEQYLQTLKGQGVQRVFVRRETLAALSQPVEVAAPTLLEPVIPCPEPERLSGRTMVEIKERAMACAICSDLASARRNVVFGAGDARAQLMFIGEAPGPEEDASGEPFLDEAGQLLTKIIKAMGFSRETVYITYLVKCRPATPGQEVAHRKPAADEIKACLPHLLAQIELIGPKVIVALGATVLNGLVGKNDISKLRGQFLQFRDIPLMPTYHPAYLVRNQAMRQKRKVWEDMLKVMERLGVPISEKQRGYFLTGA